MIRAALLAAILGCAGCLAPGTRVTVIHFSDYHSHALPFYSEGRAGQGGIARAIGYMKRAREADPNVVLVSGGDMVNRGTPAWSDRYGCAEWPWLNGLLTAMAFGNHDMDYGWDALSACRSRVDYPLLSANLLGGRPYIVRQVGGVRIGLFALSGADFPILVRGLPPSAVFADPVATARRVVAILRQQEHADAIIFIGHQEREADFAMARAVPGIDLILGTHSHHKDQFQIIPGTRTAFISPYQYLTYLSRVELRFSGHRLTGISGKLVPVDGGIAPDPEITRRVATMQADLEHDPRYAERFALIGSAATDLSIDHIDRGESVLGDLVMDVLLQAIPAQAAFSTASSFRASIPPGPIRQEDYRAALPYDNELLLFRMTGAQIQRLLDYSASRRGSGAFAVTSGLHYAIDGDRATGVTIAGEPLGPSRTYDVLTTDYMAGKAEGYRDLFGPDGRRTGHFVDRLLIDYIRAHSPIRAGQTNQVLRPANQAR